MNAGATFAYDTLHGHPHAVAHVGSDTYGYDAVGNQTSRPKLAVAYTPFDLPKTYTPTGGTPTTLEYDGDQTRVRKGSHLEETVYAGAYERVRHDQVPTEHRYYVSSNERVIAVVTRTSQDTKTAYLHADHLGSTDLVTNEVGAVVERRSYDAFGAKRDPVWGGGGGPLAAKTTVGFTGHESEDDFGLVNMKGRIFDPRLGRFLTTDPLVSHPRFSQSWNPYSYVLNNPLNGVDPSGFEDYVFADDWLYANATTSEPEGYSYDHTPGVEVRPASANVSEATPQDAGMPGTPETFADVGLASLGLPELFPGPGGGPKWFPGMGGPGGPLPAEPSPVRLPVQAPGAGPGIGTTLGEVLGGVAVVLTCGLTFSGDANLDYNPPHAEKKFAGPLDWDAVVPQHGQYAGQSRKVHVRLHNVDNLNKAEHGVFLEDGVDVVNEAWARAQAAGIVPTAKGQLTVDMGKIVGHAGGQAGQGDSVDVFRSVVIVVIPGTNKIITSYPAE